MVSRHLSLLIHGSSSGQEAGLCGTDWDPLIKPCLLSESVTCMTGERLSLTLATSGEQHMLNLLRYGEL